MVTGMHFDDDDRPKEIAGAARLALWYATLLQPYPTEVGLIFLGILLQVALYVLYPLGFQEIFDKAIPVKDTSLLIEVMIKLVILFVVCAIAAVGQTWLVARVGNRVLRDLRLKMFDRMNRLSSSFFMEVASADLVSRFSLEFGSIEFALVRALPALIECFLVVLACLATIATIDWTIALVTLFLLPFSFLAGKFLGPKVDAVATERIGLESGMIGLLNESLRARPIIRALGIERESSRKFAEQNDKILDTSVKLTFLASLIPAASLYGINILLVVIVGTGAAFVISGDLSIGAFFGCISLLMSVAAGSSSTASWYASFTASLTKVKRINELLVARPSVVDFPKAYDVPPMGSEIRFNKVVFGYSPEYPILRGATCTIKANTSVALVGLSGSGKSTMLSLIMRFFDPNAGSVTFDDMDIRLTTQTSIRRQMGVVMQEAYLMNSSIAENIRLGKLDATEEEIERAARAAEIHDFVMQLPDGYNTIVGENGGFLSGGQRQRIAIARALVREPRILLLDEPTSALDPSTEQSINEVIEDQAKDRTVIMVTHRLASVQRFTRIVVLSEGRVIEEGNHQELLELGGLYHSMWTKQSGVTIDRDGIARITPERLKAVSIFATVDLDVLASVATKFVPENFEAGSVIILQGDLSDKFYVIVRGSVEVLKTGADGSIKRVAVLHDGDHFGEIAPLKVVPRTATLRAESPTLCLSLDRKSFLELLDSQPTLRADLESHIAALS